MRNSSILEGSYTTISYDENLQHIIYTTQKNDIDTFKMMVWNMYLFSNMVTLGIYVKFPGVMIRENCSFLRLEDVFFWWQKLG